MMMNGGTMKDMVAGVFVATEIAAWIMLFAWVVGGGNWLALGEHVGSLIHAIGPLKG
jgi:hypothetical protein